MLSSLLAVAGLLSMALADEATIYPMPQVQDWQRNSIMKLSITAPEESNAVDLNFNVIPLTTSLGLNQSAPTRGAIFIRGNMVEVTPANYVNITNPDSLAYLCCDDMSNVENITPSMMVNSLMSTRPKAILLYSINGNCCGIIGDNLPYQTLFTMSNSDEAGETMNITTTGDGVVQATIAGNVTSPAQETQDNQNGSNSAVAMSILYSITGLITLLFLVIIATGAIRAHRYPERYGPRSGYGGRPRQSRAKGIARAVLETLPIVKFGESNPTKPDPAAVELESSSSAAAPDANGGTRLSAIPEEPQAQSPQHKTELPSVQEVGIGPDTQVVSVSSQEAEASGANGDGAAEEHLGCSICTEDFTVGEDVRVLPCDHKFHPACVDPWLINVSGTCPLCRLDLRPQEEQETAPGPDEAQVALPPPLEVDGHEPQNTAGVGAGAAGAASAASATAAATAATGSGSGSNPASPPRRSSRLLDLHRLRHASVEERMDILRRHVAQPQQSGLPTEGDPEDHGRRTRLADRLRDKFRVHTRTQAAEASSTRPRTRDS